VDEWCRSAAWALLGRYAGPSIGWEEIMKGIVSETRWADNDSRWKVASALPFDVGRTRAAAMAGLQGESV
jgi:hypothetical protein